jgi:hypothetical protein
MTPLEALIKNILMLAVFFILYRSYDGWQLNKKWSFLIALPLLASIALPFILNTVEPNYTEAYLNKPENNFRIPLDSVFNKAGIGAETKELSKGKHVIAFLSLSCSHCRIAASKLRIIHEREPEISMYFFLNGDDKKLKPFFEETHSENIPHSMLRGRNFVYLSGTSLPMIYLINNSVVENQVSYLDLNEKELKKWFSKP